MKGKPSENREPRMKNEHDLDKRIAELEALYAPFARDLVAPLGVRHESEPLNPWRFRYLPNGEWGEITLPEYKGETFWEGEYETRFPVPRSVAAHPRIVLLFKGLETTVEATLNGVPIGSHCGGSDPFWFDISDAVRRNGENSLSLAVKNGLAPNGIENPRAFSRRPFLKEGQFYKLVGEWGNLQGREGRAGGIWRDVVLVGTSDTWVEDCLLEPDPDRSRIRMRIRIGSRTSREIQIRADALPRNFEGNPASAAVSARVGPGLTEVHAEMELQSQKLWTPEEPFLYTARVAAIADGKPVDAKDFVFGQRRFAYDPGIRRYRLNGKPLRFRGCSTINSLNMAFLKGDAKGVVRQILLAKAASFTILRHHIMSPVEEVDLYLDMYGMMSQPEMPIWGIFHAELVETALDQLPRIARQHYNHPSTVLFALSSETGAAMPGYAQYQKRAIEIMDRDFPGLEWKIEGVRGNIGGIAGPVSPEGGRLEYKPGLFDLHEYAGWYVNLGALEPVRDGETLMTIGEFGPESLSNFSTMRGSWPEGSYPSDPSRRVTRDELPYGPQYTWAESRWFLPTPRTLREWIEQTQEHSAFVHEYVTDLYRRSPSVIGYHQYFLNEPVWNTWRKTLCGVDLSPKKAYFAMAKANAPMRLSLFCDLEHAVGGQKLLVRVFVINDTAADVAAADLEILHVSPSGRTTPLETRKVSAPMAFPVEIDPVSISVQQDGAPGTHRVEASLRLDGKVLADCDWTFEVLGPAVRGLRAPELGMPVRHFAGSPASLEIGQRLQRENPRYRCHPLAEIGQHHASFHGALVVIDNCADWGQLPTGILRDHVLAGGRLLIAESEPADLSWIIPGLEVYADPRRAQFRIDGNHPIFAGFTAKDFRLWNYLPSRQPLSAGPLHPYVGKRTRDLVDCPIRFGDKEFDRLVHISKDGTTAIFSIAEADRKASALLEIRMGKGCILASQARAFERYADHPLARVLFHRELEYLSSVDMKASREKFDANERF